MPKKTITIKQETEIRVSYRRGMTGPQIGKLLGVSLKQVYDSLRRQKVPRKSPWEQNRLRFESEQPSFVFKKNLTRRDRELLIAAAMLYYGEGAKTGTTVDLANSDERIVKIFLTFLRRICGVNEERLRFYLYCFSDQDSGALIRFWSSYLGVERAQFTKPYVRSIFNRGTRTMQHGVLHVRYSDKKLLQKIMSLISSIGGSLV